MKYRTYGTGSLYYDAQRGLWIGQIYDGWTSTGRRRRRRVTSRNKNTAREKLADLKYEVEHGIYQEGGNTTVKKWCSHWLDTRESQVRPSTLSIETAAIEQHVVPLLGTKLIKSLRPSDLTRLGEHIMDQGSSPATALRYQSVFQRALREAEREGLPVPRAILVAQKQSAGRPDRQAIPVKDALKIIKAAAGIPDGVRWLLALLQGLRQAEALGLTWDMINFQEGTMRVEWQLQSLPYLDKGDHGKGFRVPRGYEMRQLTGAFHLVRTKTLAGERVLPLTPWVAGALTAWREQAPQNPWGLLFTTDSGQPVSRHADQRAWKQLQKKAGVKKSDGKPYVTHETRHTTATLLLAAGVEPEVIKAILGHSDIVTQAAYQHVDMKLARSALTKAQKLLQIK